MSKKIIVKKNLIIFRDPSKDWTPIRRRLIEEHGPAINISYVMRKRLGFSTRYHTVWHSSGKKEGEYELKWPEEQIHLDFFNESAQSWFQLKYLNLGNT